jgi:ketosteroid isomerase-like protein
MTATEQNFAEDVQMVQTGQNRLAETFHRRNALFGHFADIGRITGGISMEPYDLLQGEAHVTALNRMTIAIDGTSREFRVIRIFRTENGKIAELRSIPEDRTRSMPSCTDSR